MYDSTSGRDREMDVGTSQSDPTSRTATATTDTPYTGTQYPTSEYASTAYTETATGATGVQEDNGVKEKATKAAKTGAQATAEGAKDVAQTAKEEVRHVAGEAATQARRVAGDVGEQLRGQAKQQHGSMVSRLRQASDDMRQMAEGRDASPATSLVGNLAERTHRFADHLESRGPEGVLDDVQEFARRRPGTFLMAAAAAGFVVGRLGKSVFTAPNSPLSSGDGGAVPRDRDYHDAYDAGTADTYAGYRTSEELRP